VAGQNFIVSAALRNSVGLYGGAWLHPAGKPTRNGGAGATNRKSPNYPGPRPLLPQFQPTLVSALHPHLLMIIIAPCGMPGISLEAAV
jgi:hypothetical protein